MPLVGRGSTRACGARLADGGVVLLPQLLVADGWAGGSEINKERAQKKAATARAAMHGSSGVRAQAAWQWA